MDLFVTGASGFLGSHFVVEWLSRHQDGRVACLVRETTQQGAEEKLMRALSRAISDRGEGIDLDELKPRLTVICGDVTDLAWSAGESFTRWVASSADLEVFHCAADLSFRNKDGPRVWHNNVGGTEGLLSMFTALPPFRLFNYVSSAFAAGTREGLVLEEDRVRPEGFVNRYEESKWTAERSVREICGAAGRAYRIFRPSMIIGHTATYRAMSNTSFYNFVSMMIRLPGINRYGPIPFPIKPGVRLDLIPVDAVVSEMLALIEQGQASANRSFHMTNAEPPSAQEVVDVVGKVLGVAFIFDVAAEEAQRHPVYEVITRGMRAYVPYLNCVRAYDRRNVESLGADGFQQRYRLDQSRLHAFVSTFIEQQRSCAPYRQPLVQAA